MLICVANPLLGRAPALARRLSGVALMDPNFAAPLSRVSSRVAQALDELQQLRPESTLWTNAFEALSQISASPRRHLFRPQLVLLGAQHRLHSRRAQSAPPSASSPLSADAEIFAAGVELQHLFMLVHDDIMDKGTIRRGLPTISVALSRGGLVRHDIVDQLATLVGDVVHAKSLELLTLGAQARPAPVLRVVNAAVRAGAAQFDDVVGWQGVERQLRAGVMLSAIQERHAQGIAVEHGFVAPLQAGLQLAAEEEQGGGSEDVLQACRAWGESAGTCFLELDDVADMVKDASESGKDALQDIREGRLSQMLFALRRLASPEEWEEVAQVLGGGEVHPMTLFDRRRTLDLLSRHRIASRTVESASQHVAKAESALLQLDPGSNLRAGLEKFCGGLREEVAKLGALAKGR